MSVTGKHFSFKFLKKTNKLNHYRFRNNIFSGAKRDICHFEHHNKRAVKCHPLLRFTHSKLDRRPIVYHVRDRCSGSAGKTQKSRFMISCLVTCLLRVRKHNISATIISDYCSVFVISSDNYSLFISTWPI